MKIAAIQMDCGFAEVDRNLKKAEQLIGQASRNGADLVLLPEFFPSAIGFSLKMNPVALAGARVHKTIKGLAERLGIIIGGSFLAFDGADSHNSFELLFPDGEVYSHQKDIPTQFENCYYTKGDTENILHTPIGDIGVALCWEMLRWDTVRRLSGKVDFVLAGSCWWDLPVDAPKEREPLRKYNQKLARETPVTFAKLLRVPLIHASHCGKVTANRFPAGSPVQTRQLVGAAQAVGADGEVLARRDFSEGEGIVYAEIFPGKTERRPADIPENAFWIPNLPESYLTAWREINPIAESYYRKQMHSFYQLQYSQYH